MKKFSIYILTAILTALGFSAIYGCDTPDLYGCPPTDFDDSIPGK